MKKKRIVLGIGLIIVVVLLNIYLLTSSTTAALENVSLNLTMTIENNDTLQIYHTSADTEESMLFSEGSSSKMGVFTTTNPQEFNFTIPANTTYVRMDTGVNRITVSKITIGYRDKLVEMPQSAIAQIVNSNDMEESSGETVTFTSNGEDPYIIWNLQDADYQQMIREYQNSPMKTAQKIFGCVVID